MTLYKVLACELTEYKTICSPNQLRNTYGEHNVKIGTAIIIMYALGEKSYPLEFKIYCLRSSFIDISKIVFRRFFFLSNTVLTSLYRTSQKMYGKYIISFWS